MLPARGLRTLLGRGGRRDTATSRWRAASFVREWFRNGLVIGDQRSESPLEGRVGKARMLRIRIVVVDGSADGFRKAADVGRSRKLGYPDLPGLDPQEPRAGSLRAA